MSDLHATLARMNTIAPGAETPPTESPGYSELVNRNIKAEIVRAGKRYVDLESAEALDLSHASAMRRLSGETEWRLSEVESVARWLGIDIDRLTALSS